MMNSPWLGILFLGFCYEHVHASKPTQAQDQWYTDAVDLITKRIDAKPNHNPAKNVIIFVGDGCDITTNTAARILKGQLKGKTGEEESLTYERFPYTGLSKTYNTDKQVPDSAGTANAIFGGVKTRTGVIGFNEDVVLNTCSTVKDSRRVDSIMKLAELAGMSTGLVTNMRVTHATPANLYSSSPNRYWESDYQRDKRASNASACKDIAQQMIDFQGSVGDGVEVIFGGGRRAFLPNTTADPEHVNKTGERRDKRNLIQEWLDKREGSQFVWNKTQMEKIDPKTAKHVLGLFETSNMNYESERANDVAGEPSLTEMVEKAINILKQNSKGFFLAVEGGLIDYGHHDNRANLALTEAVEMDNAVAKAVTMTSAEDTLIIVTADHGHTMTISGYPDRGNPIFGLVHQFGKLEVAYNDKKPFTTIGYMNGPNSRDGARANLTGVDTKSKTFAQQSLYNGLDKYESHGGQDVGIYSRGPWADLLTGVVEQNVIFHVMDHALCLTDSKKSKCTKPEARGGPSPSSGGAAVASSVTIVTSLLYVMISVLVL